MTLVGRDRRISVQLRTIAFVAFAAHDVERARRPLVHRGAVDIATIDVIARLRLRARRAGLELTVHDPVPELVDLLGLAGLGALIRSARPPFPARD